MARIADSLKLSTAEVDTIMAGETRCRISTLGQDLQINLTPMTFGWAGGKVYIFGRGKKVSNLRNNSTATLLVDTGDKWRELKGIMMQGQAVLLEDSNAEQQDQHLAAAQLNLGVKHQLQKEGELLPYKATAAGNSRRWIVFQPETIVTWNNQKLP